LLESEYRYANAKSTGQSSKGAATHWALDYLKNGPIVTQARITLEKLATGFFSPDGDYLAVQKLRNKNLSLRHIQNQQSYLDNYIVPQLGRFKLVEITTGKIDDFVIHLNRNGLSASTINHILQTTRILMKWALKKGYI
jgi:hypothetical protein